jgi:hypothetical protein
MVFFSGFASKDLDSEAFRKQKIYPVTGIAPETCTDIVHSATRICRLDHWESFRDSRATTSRGS